MTFVVRQRGVGDDFTFAVALQRFVTEFRMTAFLFVVDGFADVVHQAAASSKFRIQSHIGGHRAAEEGDFLRVLQHVLTVAGAPL